MNGNTQKYNITFSEKEKMILFLPGKTGTMHASFIFNHFDFTTHLYDSQTEELVMDYNAVIHHHDLITIKKFENYNSICTARNPYTRLVSAYYNTKKNGESVGKPIEDFKSYFSKNIEDGGFFHKNGFFFKETPTFFLRVENLYHDYIQIPFIRNSKLNKTGILYDLCNKKIHSNSENNKSLKELYTQDMADYVYNRFKSYFDMLGYDRNSWKQ